MTTKTAPSSTDRIEKHITLNAPRSRVWRAIADPQEFGQWFQMKLNGQFTPGATVLGKLTVPGYENVTVEMKVEEVKPETHLSYRWHPGAIDPKVDYSVEPMTLVEFHLADAKGADGGTALTIIESGFDALPADRRAEAYRMDEGGWNGQLRNIEKHVTR
jgi:uncharacterized protein YndB with AHSA1/START domain